MTPSIIRPSNLYGSRQVSGGLLFQFTLNEAFRVHKQLQILGSIFSQATPYPESEPTALVQKHFDAMSAAFRTLVGQPQGPTTPFYWGHESGVLNKLSHYFSLYMQQQSSNIDSTLHTLQHAFREMLLMTLQCRDILHLTRDSRIETPTNRYKELLDSCQHINSHLTQALRELVTLIPQFQNDENLLFFLLRYQEQIDELCGTKSLNSLLSSLFPNGFEELETFLHEKYSARSFQHVLPAISEKLALLTKKT